MGVDCLHSEVVRSTIFMTRSNTTYGNSVTSSIELKMPRPRQRCVAGVNITIILRSAIPGCIVVVVDVAGDADVLVDTNGDLVVRNVGMTAIHFANIY